MGARIPPWKGTLLGAIVDILIIIREGTEVIRPLACGSESTVATCVAVINYYTSIAFCILVPTAYFR